MTLPQSTSLLNAHLQQPQATEGYTRQLRQAFSRVAVFWPWICLSLILGVGFLGGAHWDRLFRTTTESPTQQQAQQQTAPTQPPQELPPQETRQPSVSKGAEEFELPAMIIPGQQDTPSLLPITLRSPFMRREGIGAEWRTGTAMPIATVKVVVDEDTCSVTFLTHPNGLSGIHFRIRSDHFSRYGCPTSDSSRSYDSEKDQ